MEEVVKTLIMVITLALFVSSVNSIAAPSTDVCAVYPTPTEDRPSYNTPILKSIATNFWMLYNRITDLPGILLPCNGAPNCDSTGPWGDNAIHHYSKDNAFSSPSATSFGLLSIDNHPGIFTTQTSELYLDRCLGARTDSSYFDIARGKCPGYSSGDDRWLPGSHSVRVQVTADTTPQYLRWTDVTTCTVTREWIINQTANYWKAIGAGEGQITEDGRYVALEHDADSTFIVVDMNSYPTFRSSATINAGTPCYLSGTCTLGWVSMSPRGAFVVVSYSGSQGERVWSFADDGTTMTIGEKAYSDRLNGSCVPNCALSPQSCVNGKSAFGDAQHGHVYALSHSDMIWNTEDVEYSPAEWLVGGEKCGLYGANSINARWQGSKTTAGRLIQVRLNDGALEVPLPYRCGSPLREAVASRHASAAGARLATNRNWLTVSWDNECAKPYSANPNCNTFTETKRYSSEITAVHLIGPVTTQASIKRYGKHHSTYSIADSSVCSNDHARYCLVNGDCVSPGTCLDGCYWCEPQGQGFAAVNMQIFKSNWCYKSTSCADPTFSQEYAIMSTASDPCP